MAGQFPDPTPFIEQAHRILEQARDRQLTLRLLGAIAFHLRCPNFNYIQRETGRAFTDIDFMGYFKQMQQVEKLFRDLGYREDRRIKSVPGLRRSIFLHAEQPWHSDVFYDVLEFSHEVDLRGRLEIDFPTISLVDLLLEKLQIARINEKDIIDTLMLLREHEVGEFQDMTTFELTIWRAVARPTGAYGRLSRPISTRRTDRLTGMTFSVSKTGASFETEST